MIKIQWKKIVLVSCIACSLSGCIAVGGAAIGAAGTAVVYDRQNINATINDQNIGYNILQNLKKDSDLNAQAHIVVTCYRGTVLLAGQTPTQELKDRAANIAQQAKGVKRLYNEITIEAPSSLLTRTSDSWITTKIKTEFLAAKKLKSGQFKVVTENGTVFLMGIVSRSQANQAVNIARKVQGVEKVVKIFEYNRELDQSPSDVAATKAIAKEDASSSNSTDIPTEEPDSGTE